MAKKIGTLVILGLVLFFAVMGIRYLHYRKVNAVSDAAFIKSDRLAILGFKVGGKVIRLNPVEGDRVKKGEILAKIDPVDFRVSRERALHQLQAMSDEVKAMRLKRARLQKILADQQAMAAVDVDALSQRIAALKFRIAAARKRLQKLSLDTARYQRMLDQRLVARGDFEAIRTKKEALSEEIDGMVKERDALKEQRKKAVIAEHIAKVNRKELRELEAQIRAKIAQEKALQKSIQAIDDEIAYTILRAPFDGIIAKKFIDAPRVVKKGSPVYALADPKALYCEVLLSEKKLHGVRPGNKVTITVEALPDREYHGTVSSIAPTSASTFSLVPRDIASGEFTKLDQRFVVRIKLKKIDALRAGMGATVAIRRR